MGRAEYFDPVSQSRKPIKSGSIVNNAGLEYTPEDVKEIDDKIGILRTDHESHEADYVTHTGYGNASGTNAKTITLNPVPTGYTDGMTVAFKNVTQNSGAVTLNVNGKGAKAILKSNGSALASGNLKANSIYTVRYNGTSFILQGEGGEYGTALASDVLSPKTIGTESGIVSGTMPNNGARNGTITTQGGQINIPAGYHDGTGSVEANILNLVPENISKDVNVGGIIGSYVGGMEYLGETTFIKDITVVNSPKTEEFSVTLSKGTKFVVISGRFDAFEQGSTYSQSSGTLARVSAVFCDENDKSLGASFSCSTSFSGTADYTLIMYGKLTETLGIATGKGSTKKQYGSYDAVYGTVADNKTFEIKPTPKGFEIDHIRFGYYVKASYYNNGGFIANLKIQMYG